MFSGGVSVLLGATFRFFFCVVVLATPGDRISYWMVMAMEIRTGRNVPRGWEDGQRAAPQMGQVRIVRAVAMENELNY